MNSGRLEKALDSVCGSLAIENLHLEDQEKKMIKSCLEGKLTEDEFKQKVLYNKN